jgi:cytoskeletal protein CcmA (bactofilin family)
MSIFGKKPEQEPQKSSSPSPKPTPDPVSPPASPKPKPAPAAKPTASPAPAPSAADKKSFLNAGCELKGEFSGEGSFECGGKFEGTIDITGDLIVGHGGAAKAELKARRIDIEGRLTGNATASKKVEVGPSGHVEGDVRAPAVQFAEGAFFEGNVEMRRPRSDSQGGADSGGSAKPGGASSAS